MSARLQAVVVLGTCLLVRPTVGSAAQGVHVDAVSAQVYLVHTKSDQTKLVLQRKDKVADSKGLAKRGLAICAGFTALLEAPAIWDKLSSMFGWCTTSDLELSHMLEGDLGRNNEDDHEEPWKMKGYFATICLCTFALGIMRRSCFRRPSSRPSSTFDTCVATPRVERCTKKKKSVTLVSPRRGMDVELFKAGDEASDTEDVEFHRIKAGDGASDPEDVEFHRIYTPGQSRQPSKSAAYGWEAQETQPDIHFHRIDTPETSRALSMYGTRSTSTYGWEAQ
eukprot:TRINITY_DN73757_c0_g1_i1.p1 TRINITY_DN73757_c0_g1~~TRINITY_DN73757_c0_g1_i1.p1  ORF type:complete len:280 (+),score=49.88 TRINITY_DN73757_c0_g1_i1:105-944(+)